MEVERRKAKLLPTQLSVLSSKRRTNEGLDSLVGLSVDAILSGELARPIKPQQQTNTLTLLDIISNEESGAAYRGLAALNGTSKHKKKSSSKKSIKDRLKFRKPSSASSWASSASVPTSDLPTNNKKNRGIEQISDPVLVDRPLLASLSLRSSMKLLNDCQVSDLKSKSDSSSDDDEEENINNTTSEKKEKQEEPESSTHTEPEPVVDDRNVSVPFITEPDEEEEEEQEDEKSENEPGPSISESIVEAAAPTVSLMALLEESGRRVDDDDEEDDEDDDDEDDEGTGVKYICTVCMVKHRRLAFVPCGHTFCRLCSKELWVSRGNCPLCTGYILEILDIL